MPNYIQVNIDLSELQGRGFFVKARDTFPANEVRRARRPTASEPQLQFQERLATLARLLGTRTIPIFLRFRENLDRRLDKGRIGHSVANGFLRPLENGPYGFVEYVTLSDETSV